MNFKQMTIACDISTFKTIEALLIKLGYQYEPVTALITKRDQFKNGFVTYATGLMDTVDVVSAVNASYLISIQELQCMLDNLGDKEHSAEPEVDKGLVAFSDVEEAMESNSYKEGLEVLKTLLPQRVATLQFELDILELQRVLNEHVLEHTNGDDVKKIAGKLNTIIINKMESR